MRKHSILILSIFLLNISLVCFANVPNNQVLIRFKEEYKKNDIDKFINSYKLKNLKVLSGINIYVLEVPKDIKNTDFVKKVEKVGIVKYVEANKNVDLSRNFVKESEKVDYSKLLDKEVTITGMYEYNRAGAMFSNDSGSISLVDLDNRVILRLPENKDGSKLQITGIVRKIKGYNVTNDLGLLPISVKEVK